MGGVSINLPGAYTRLPKPPKPPLTSPRNLSSCDMKQWEYHKESSNVIQIERLNELGWQGWELVGVDSFEIGFSFLYFKRELSLGDQRRIASAAQAKRGMKSGVL